MLSGGLLGNTSGSISGGTLQGSASGELIVITPLDLTIGSVIADNGGATALTKTGPGTLTLTGGNRYSGVTTIGAGALQVSGTGTLGTGPVTDDSALVFNPSGVTTYGSAISGPGSLTQAGGGELILSGSNDYSGGTTVNAGTLIVTNANALPAGSNLTVGGGSFVYDPSAAAAPASGASPAASISPVARAGNPDPVGGGVGFGRRYRPEEETRAIITGDVSRISCPDFTGFSKERESQMSSSRRAVAWPGFWIIVTAAATAGFIAAGGGTNRWSWAERIARADTPPSTPDSAAANSRSASAGTASPKNAGGPKVASVRSYSTRFQLDEDPISEGGKWINGAKRWD